MSETNFTCPINNRPCMYPGYCETVKDVQDLNDQAGEVTPLTDPLDKADASSYCSDERILAIGNVAYEILTSPTADPVTSERVRKIATGLAASILISRDKFRE